VSRAALAALAIGVTVALAGCGGTGPTARSQWSVFEDHDALVREGEARREQTLDELRELGVDTLRVGIKWNEAAPRPLSRTRPRFDATDSEDYPGFDNYDDLVQRATDKGFRIVAYLAPDAPRWATEARERVTAGTVNKRPDPRAFADFAEAVARRYSGKIEWFSIWNEPNHVMFLKPQRESPRIYRELVAAALPRIREHAPDAEVLVGETAPVGKPGTTIGPAEFLRRWLCLDENFERALVDRTCAAFTRLDVDGFAHHPYGPTQRVPVKEDVVSLLVIRRLGRYLDRAARAGRMPLDLPIYNTEFGLQSNPPDPTVSTTLARQAALINEKEELSYRYPRLRSYSQYLMYDDPPRPDGTDERAIWSGFQTGLRFTDGQRKPSWAAFRLPIVVHTRGAGRVLVWGRVRPGEGERTVRLELRRRGTWTLAREVETNDAGYFETRLPRAQRYRYRAFSGDRAIGSSRAATPVD
jgi:hypothetical protein